LETLRAVLQREEVILEKLNAEATVQGIRHEAFKQALIKLKPELEADLMSDEGEDEDAKRKI
jgi:hypothetical protein